MRATTVALMLVASALLLLSLPTTSATSLTEEKSNDSSDASILRRQRRNPLIVAAVVRAGAPYVVRIGATVVRSFKTLKQAKDFLRQPSTLRQINRLPKDQGNIVSVPSKTMAKKLANRLSKDKPVYHGNPNRGDPHFHPVGKAGNKMSAHISHPRTQPKSPTKYRSGAKDRASKAASKDNLQAQRSRVNGESSRRGGSAERSRNGGSGSRVGSMGGGGSRGGGGSMGGGGSRGGKRG